MAYAVPRKKKSAHLFDGHDSVDISISHDIEYLNSFPDLTLKIILPPGMTEYVDVCMEMLGRIVPMFPVDEPLDGLLETIGIEKSYIQ